MFRSLTTDVSSVPSVQAGKGRRGLPCSSRCEHATPQKIGIPVSESSDVKDTKQLSSFDRRGQDAELRRYVLQPYLRNRSRRYQTSSLLLDRVIIFSPTSASRSSKPEPSLFRTLTHDVQQHQAYRARPSA